MRETNKMSVRPYIVIVSLLAASIMAIPAVAELALPDESSEATINLRCKEVLLDGLSCEAFWPRMHAAEALTDMGFGEYVSLRLQPMLPETTDPQHRVGLARELVRAGQGDKVSLILAALQDPESSARIHAAETLFKLGLIGDTQTMRSAMQQQDNPGLRAFAAAAIARYEPDDQQAKSILHELLNHPEETPRRYAAFTLGLLGDHEAEELLVQNADRPELEPSMQVPYLQALARLGNERGLASLSEQLTSETASVRAHTTVVVGEVRDLSLKQALVGLLNDPEPDVRIRSAHALWMLCGPVDRNSEE
jgi:HEAT repeat protein